MEIKFRMWNNVESDKSKSRMFYDIEQVMECLKQQMNFNDDESTRVGYNYIGDGNVFMQFTGLKDKNGKDIYCKDYLKNPKGEIGKVINYEAGFYLECPRKGGTIFYIPLTNGFVQNKEISGNEFETPELIK